MRDAGFDQLQFDRFDSSVVHVRRRHAMGARFCIGDGDVADAIYGESIVEGAVIAQDAAVAVGGVFAETDIGNDEQGGESGAEEADGLDDWSFGVVGSSAQGIFHVGSCRYAEKDDGGKAFPDKRLEVGNDPVDPAAMLIRERGNESFLVCRVGDEERIYEHRLDWRSVRLGRDDWYHGKRRRSHLC